MLDRIEPSRITLARRIAGLSKMDLAKRLEVSPGTVQFWEDGARDATGRLQQIVEVLGQTPAFFISDAVPYSSIESVSFRKRYDAIRKLRDRATAAIDLSAGVITPSLRDFFGADRWRSPDAPNMAGLRPEAAAIALRSHWGLSDGPLRNVVEQMEARGIRVSWITEESPSLSAFCKWVNGEPFVVLNTAKRDGCRSRFDAAHELGHLVLHQDVDFDKEDLKRLEREADSFASAFLMPRDSFLRDAPVVLDIDRLIQVKKVWKVSIQAMVRRLYDLNVLSPWQYEQAFRGFSMKGWRSGPEPFAGMMEQSKIHWILCDRLEQKDVALQQFVTRMGLDWETASEAMPVLKARQSGFSVANLIGGNAPLGLDAEVMASLPYDD